MKFTVTLLLAVFLGYASDATSSYLGGPPIPPLTLEQLGNAYVFLCETNPAIYCDSIIASLPPQATPGDAARAILQTASLLRPRNAGGVYSMSPVPRGLLKTERISGALATACHAVADVNCDEILRYLPPYADESDAASVLGQVLGGLRIAPPNQYTALNIY